jgi:hypothetical protein
MFCIFRFFLNLLTNIVSPFFVTMLPLNVWDILVVKQPFLGRVAYCYSIYISLILKVRVMTMGSSCTIFTLFVLDSDIGIAI